MSIAVYAGRFDPITGGHLSVLEQAVRLFSDVRVLVADVPGEKTFFSAQERVELAKEATGSMSAVQVDVTSSPIVEYAAAIGATTLVRGLRGVTDAAAESALANDCLLRAPGIHTVWLPVDPRLSGVTSSVLKALVLRGDPVSVPCPPRVLERLRECVQSSVKSARRSSRPSQVLRQRVRSAADDRQASGGASSPVGLEAVQDDHDRATSEGHDSADPTVFDGAGEADGFRPL